MKIVTKAGVVLTQTIAGFLLLNIIFGIVHWLRDRSISSSGKVAQKYGIEKLSQAYPGWNSDDLKTLLSEHDQASQFEFEPYTGFQSKPMKGRFVHIENGYRRIDNQASWPPTSEGRNLFVFGGSTAFGFGLPDDQTIPAFLQKEVIHHCHQSFSVYNFGRIGYVSSQELALFTQLIRQGNIPEIAIFIDGMNEFSEEFQNMGFEQSSGGIWKQILLSLPLIRFLQHDSKGYLGKSIADTNIEMLAKSRVRRWLVNKQMIESIAENFRIPVLFVWQPVPVYRYNLSHQLFADHFAKESEAGRFEIRSIKKGYELMEGKRLDSEMQNVLWLADLQEHVSENLYVDMWHYNPEFSHQIARTIASYFCKRMMSEKTSEERSGFTPRALKKPITH